MLTPNTLLQGRYRVVRKLARGGMGTIYEATDERLDAVVAIKETSFEEEELRRQFEREARLLARLSHPALPRVSDHFAESGGQFLVMQYVEGEDLDVMRRKSAGGSFPVAQVLAWADQILDALDYLHTRRPPVIHRDIKPHNLKPTGRGQIILLDFGLAKGYGSRTSQPGESILGGTPAYAPLEQMQGKGTDASSDLYSLGATLYHLMTGVIPPNAMERADALLNGKPDPLWPADRVGAPVSPEVATVLNRAMALRRDHRIDTAEEMRRALREAGEAHGRQPSQDASTLPMPDDEPEDLTKVHAPDTAPAPASWLRRRPALIAVLVGSLAALLVIGVVGAALKLMLPRVTDSRQVAAGVTPTPSPSQPNPTPLKNNLLSATGDAETGLTLPHDAEVYGIAFSPDGGLLATSDGQTLRFWDTGSGHMLATSQDLGGAARPIAASPDGKLLTFVHYSQDNCAVVPLGMRGGKPDAEARSIQIQNCPLQSAALSPDGKFLATGSGDISLWNTQTGELTQAFQTHGQRAESVALSPNGALLAAADDPFAVHLWDVRKGTVTYEAPVNRPSAVAFSPDGNTLATGNYGELMLWNVGGRAPWATFKYESSSKITSVTFSPDGRLVACGGEDADGRVKVWEVRTGDMKLSLNAGGSVYAVAFSPDGKRLACATSAKSVKLWQVDATARPAVGAQQQQQLAATPQPRKPAPRPTQAAPRPASPVKRCACDCACDDKRCLARCAIDN
jgi:serine/threonine protein kinase